MSVACESTSAAGLRELFALAAEIPYRPEERVAPWGASVRYRAMTEQPESAVERSLVEAAQRGDPEAVRSLFARFARPLYSAVILPRVGLAAEADEVLRDALSRAVERLQSYRWTQAGFFPWLRQIAVHLIIDRARARHRRAKLDQAFELHLGVVAPLHHAGADEALIEQQERAQLRAQLDQALSTLNERYRRVIELRILEERTREACAAELNVTVGNFDVILHRALSALRKAYGTS